MSEYNKAKKRYDKRQKESKEMFEKMDNVVEVLLLESEDMKFLDFVRKFKGMNPGSVKMEKAVVWKCPGCEYKNIEYQLYRFAAVRCENCGRLLEAEYDFE